jgi:hypothetical protein
MSENFFPKNIVLVGCGGTGSWLAHSLVHFIYEAYNKELISSFKDVKVWFVDFDSVEAKNIVRQVFLLEDIGEIKSTVLDDRYGNIILSEAIPEAVNSATLPKIFTPEILKENLCVISAVDRREVSSQLYFWLIEQDAAGRMGNWSWHYSGAQLSVQNIASPLRDSSVSFSLDVPYITTIMYGRFNGVPLTGPLLPPHEVYTDILKPLPEGAVGMRSDATVIGCGMSTDDDVRQASQMNMAAARYLMLTISMLYFEKVVVGVLRENNLTMTPEWLCSLDELLSSAENPALENEVRQVADEVVNTDEALQNEENIEF